MRVVAMPSIETTGNLEFEEIFNAYSRLVYRTAYAVTGRHEDAEDVLQTIFLRLARREVASHVLRNPKRYLSRSAVNVSLNVIRSRRREATLRDATRLELARTQGAQLGLLPAELTDPLGPTIFDALGRIGLTLERSKASREFIVIDHIERPSAN